MSEREMAKLLALVEKHLGRGWLDLADWLREQNQVDAIEARIVAGDYAGAVTKIENAALKYAADIHQSYVTAGRTEAAWLDARTQLSDRLIRFDETNVRTVERARTNQLDLVRGFTQEQREKTQQVLVEGLERGTNPRVMARSLRDGLGLTAKQEEHVRNFRQDLEEGRFGDAMRRELRDARSDRTLRRLMADGGELTADQVDMMVDRFRANYVSFRAKVIARTEGLRAANEGSADAIRQAIDRGDVEADQLVKTWHAARPRPTARDWHQAMNDVEVPFEQDFNVGGTLMAYPGDPRGGVRNNAQCRCTMSTTLKALEAAA